MKAWLVACTVDQGLGKQSRTIVVVAYTLQEIEHALDKFFYEPGDLVSIDKVEHVAGTVIDVDGNEMLPRVKR